MHSLAMLALAGALIFVAAPSCAPARARTADAAGED
jgi:hypothetical protein